MSVGREGVFAVAELSHADFIGRSWSTVCRALGMAGTPVEEGGHRMSDLLRPWGSRPIGSSCAYPSEVSRDGFPAELSVNWSRRGAEVRILFEALGPEDCAESCRDAGVALLDRLEAERDAYLGWYHKISDLYVSDDGPIRSMWHSMACRPGSEPLYKVYLDARPHGFSSVDLMAETTERLGVARAWRHLTGYLSGFDSPPELEYIALDLVDAPGARFKVYFRNHDATARDLDRLASVAATHRSGPARRAYAHLLPDGVEAGNEPLTCLAFRPDCDRPTEATTYLRIPGMARTEQDASLAVAGLMRECGFDPAGYQAMIAGLLPDRPERISGLQELLSCRVKADAVDLTVYLRFGVYAKQVNSF